MKKEIMKLVNSERGYYQLNNVATLHRWTKNALGSEVDCLEIMFKEINDVWFTNCRVNIESRDFNGIIEECQNATTAYFKTVAEELNKRLKNGYRNI